MVRRVGPQDQAIVLDFGGGIHSRASPDEIDPKETVFGNNFQLDLRNFNLRPRKPFDLVGTVPSTADMTINGFASLLKTDGTVSFLVQAGVTVYDWDGTSSFTSKGTVVSGAKIRGRLESNWQLTDKVIITDIAQKEPVLEYDGTTLANVTFTKNDGSTAWTGNFIARYCVVDNERAIFSNIEDNSSALPHLIVGSKRGDYTIISNDNRPSTAINEEDPFFLIQPDYRYINGMVGAYDVIITSSLEGDIFRFTGSNAQDFAMTPLHPRSGANGDESLVFVSNDALYGRAGRIEALSGVERFGDVETNDLSLDIADRVETFTDWTLVYNSRLQRVYCFSSGQSELFVLYKSLIGQIPGQENRALSPWSRWLTNHAIDFQPTAVMNALDPTDGLEYVFMGDSSGNIYRMEGSGSAGDAGTTAIATERLSKVFTIPVDAEAYFIDGWIEYKKLDQATVKLTFEYQGHQVFDQGITIEIPGTSTVANTYNNNQYYNSGIFYGSSFRERLKRQRWAAAGRGSSLQVRVVIETVNDFEISEIGLRFTAAS